MCTASRPAYRLRILHTPCRTEYTRVLSNRTDCNVPQVRFFTIFYTRFIRLTDNKVLLAPNNRREKIDDRSCKKQKKLTDAIQSGFNFWHDEISRFRSTIKFELLNSILVQACQKTIRDKHRVSVLHYLGNIFEKNNCYYSFGYDWKELCSSSFFCTQS